jgi:hypothetical protein
MRVIGARAGERGFDLNQVLTTQLCKEFSALQFSFAIRYIRRSLPHPYDLSQAEIGLILDSGLGLQLVQHVAPVGWQPNIALGQIYGRIAAREAELLRVPEQTMIWCDLEGVARNTLTEDTIAYCNAWYGQVKQVGFTPGLYVGDSCGLSAKALYHRLKFQHYWAAYNLNLDQHPLVRGVQMQQRAARPEERPAGVEADGFDVDVVVPDALGGLPLVVVAS